MGHPASPGWGCPIRTSPDHSLLAAPRGLSQPSTSFFGSWCQGIHHAPLLARRLDLSQLQAGRINVLKRPNSLSSRSLSTALGIGGTEPVCSTTLWFFRYVAWVLDQRFRAVLHLSLESAGRGASTGYGSSRHDRLSRCCLLFTYGHKKRPDIRRATHGNRKSSHLTMRLSTPLCG